MKILMVHNYLRPPSGENTVFEQEKKLLESKGDDVVVYIRENQEIYKKRPIENLSLPFTSIWSRRSYSDIKKIIQKFRPDVAHFHNIFPLISPAAYHACRQMGVPVVQTLHHFRLVCPGALLFRNEQICEDCAGLKFFHGIKYACYRSSRIHTAGVAAMIYIHYIFRTWQDCVDIYIALSTFAKYKFQELKFPSNRICIKPNFLEFAIEPSSTNKGFAMFVGRLGEEKGISCLLEAFRSLPDIKLKIFGDGPEKRFLLNYLNKNHLNNVEYMGLVNHDQVLQYLRDAQFLIFPSIWYEGMPMVVLEAMAAAKPVIATRLGVMPEMIKDGVNGLICEPGSVSDLKQKLEWLSNHPNEAAEMGKRGRKAFEEKYTPDINYKLLINIYQWAIKRRKL